MIFQSINIESLRLWWQALRIFEALRAAAATLSTVSAFVALAALVPQAVPGAASAGAVGVLVPAVLTVVAAGAAFAWRKLSDEVEKFHWCDSDIIWLWIRTSNHRLSLWFTILVVQRLH